MASKNMAAIVCTLLVAGTVVGLAGIDLILPAIPTLPETLGGSPTLAQFVIAAFVGGTAAGLLLFGYLGSTFPRQWLLFAALVLYAVTSLLAGFAESMANLILLRFAQGVVSAAPAVFAPAIIRRLFDETAATKVLGLFGSIESLVPALAPIVGLWLLNWGGWTTSFLLIAALAGLLALGIGTIGGIIPPARQAARSGSYLKLIRSTVFIRYSLSHACVLGGLLVFVFGAPAVIVRSLGGSLTDFIVMQVAGVSLFIVAANASGFLAERWGAEPLITFGTWLAALSAAALLVVGLFDLGTTALILSFVPMNAGLGLRGPPGFLRAIMAGGGDDDRASSLLVLCITGVAAGGTALVAPILMYGLPALAGAVLAIQLVAVVALSFLPKLEPAEP